MLLSITNIYYIIKRKINLYNETVWQKRSGLPSVDCQDAWVYYYSKSHMVDINTAFFKDMVKNWGTPDWSNPYPPGTQEYYLIHPQGFFMWDVEQILTPVSPPGTVKEDTENALGQSLKKDALMEKGIKRYKRQNNIRNACVDCLSILLAERCSIERMALLVNNKDLKAIVTEAVVYGNYEIFGYNIKKVLLGAYKQNLIDKEDIAKLYNARKNIDLEERNEIEMPPEPDQYNPDLPKLNIR